MQLSTTLAALATLALGVEASILALLDIYDTQECSGASQQMVVQFGDNGQCKTYGTDAIPATRVAWMAEYCTRKATLASSPFGNVD